MKQNIVLQSYYMKLYSKSYEIYKSKDFEWK